MRKINPNSVWRPSLLLRPGPCRKKTPAFSAPYFSIMNSKRPPTASPGCCDFPTMMDCTLKTVIQNIPVPHYVALSWNFITGTERQNPTNTASMPHFAYTMYLLCIPCILPWLAIILEPKSSPLPISSHPSPPDTFPTGNNSAFHFHEMNFITFHK